MGLRQPALYSELQDSLGYGMNSCPKEEEEREGEGEHSVMNV